MAKPKFTVYYDREFRLFFILDSKGRAGDAYETRAAANKAVAKLNK